MQEFFPMEKNPKIASFWFLHLSVFICVTISFISSFTLHFSHSTKYNLFIQISLHCTGSPTYLQGFWEVFLQGFWEVFLGCEWPMLNPSPLTSSRLCVRQGNYGHPEQLRQRSEPCWGENGIKSAHEPPIFFHCLLLIHFYQIFFWPLREVSATADWQLH